MYCKKHCITELNSFLKLNIGLDTNVWMMTYFKATFLCIFIVVEVIIELDNIYKSQGCVVLKIKINCLNCKIL